MTLYLMSVHGTQVDPAPSPEEMQQMFADVDVFNQELKAKGHWVFAAGLYPPETATVVSVKDGQTVTTDGPYAETKEHLGGFWVVTAADLDEALDLAAQGSVACRWPVEVRPIQDDEAAYGIEVGNGGTGGTDSTDGGTGA
jgi:hypothetical protein